MYVVVGCGDCSASIAKCHTLHAIAYPLSRHIDGVYTPDREYK